MGRLGKEILCFLLAAALLPACLPGVRAETILPESTEETQAVTLPEEATEAPPEEPIPEESAPEESVPEESAPEEPVPEESVPEEPVPEETIGEIIASDAALTDADVPPGPGLYFGLLRCHTAFSGGTGTPEDAFSFAAGSGLDFLALTDHGSTLGSDDWDGGIAAAQSASGNTFTGLFGYEMNWPAAMQLGHIAAFQAADFHSWEESAFSSADSALQNFYGELAATGAVGMFCHPGTQYGTFSDFDHYSSTADNAMQLMEVFWYDDAPGDGCDSYIRALDKGWHLAPTANSSGFDHRWGCNETLRTVVDARSLTEAGIYEAIRNRRVYATEDSDLQILYTLDGFAMGSVAKLRRIGETADISLSLLDPTDTAIGLVEVVTEAGAVIASRNVDNAYEQLTFSLSPEYSYYFLKITQPDGDQAVTAPIWVDSREHLGISSLECATPVPLQNQPASFSLTLFNREPEDFTVETLEILADGVSVLTDTSLSRIAAGASITHTLSLSCDHIGLTRITARLQGTLEGAPRQYEATVDVSFRRSDQVTDILLDPGFGAGNPGLSLLPKLAAESDILVDSWNAAITPEELEQTRFLVIADPDQPFSQDFLQTVTDYVDYGGSVLLCGQSDQLNRLLETLGSSLRLGEDALPALTADTLNTQSVWWQGLSQGQTYCQEAGCAVNPGSGTWLARDDRNRVLLAQEDTPAGGSIFLSGAFPFADSCLSESKNIWQLPSANHVLLKNMMAIGGDALPLSTIRQVQSGTSGDLVRIRGYVTAGTATACNRFPDTLYLQDETGGIAVMPFSVEGIAPGTPLEIIGSLQTGSRNPVLKYSSHKVLDAAAHRYPAKTGSWKTLLNPDLHGGRLVQAEGICQDVRLRSDGTLIRCTLKDSKGNTIQILVEDGIGSHATGKNALHRSIRKGRTVRAAGILYVDSEGIPVIRVRNCEEVVWVPERSSDIPDTSDFITLPVFLLALTLPAGILLGKKKNHP